MLIGPYCNAAAVVVGGLAGAVLAHKIPTRLREALPQTFGLCSMGLGILLIVEAKSMPAVVLAMVLGAILGEMLYLEKGIGHLAGRVKILIDKIFPSQEKLSHQELFVEKFVVILVLFSASSTGIFGAMHEGMTGDPSILLVKTILDLFTAAIFAASLGFAVVTIAIPLLLIQLSLVVLSTFISPLITPQMMADFSAAGGLIMLATGVRICEIKLFPVANMLPALLLVMPLSYLWNQFFI